MHVISTSLPRQMHKINVTNKYFIQTLNYILNSILSHKITLVCMLLPIHL